MTEETGSRENPKYTTIEGLLEALQLQADESRRVMVQAIEKIAERAIAYQKAVEALEVNKLDAKLGLSPSEPTDWPALTRTVQETDAALRTATVEFLTLGAQRVAGSAGEEPVRAIEVSSPTVEPVRQPAAGSRSDLIVDPEVDALWREFNDAGLDVMADNLFRTWAQEYAARARLLQDRLPPDPEGPLTRIIRMLTRMAHDREIRDIYGLAQRHKADWTVHLSRARTDRERIRSTQSER